MKTSLITGAGPIGIMAAVVGRAPQRGRGGTSVRDRDVMNNASTLAHEKLKSTSLESTSGPRPSADRTKSNLRNG
jgi:hypothetical protein